MAGNKRLSLGRVAGIAAWTAASVTWGTVGVAIANQGAATTDALPLEPETLTPPATEDVAVTTSLPTMPERGLVILRYTPAPKPEPKVVVVRKQVSSSASTTRVRSSGS